MTDSDSSKSNSPADPAISRRDFLRRAGKEAAVTGTKFVPGAVIAQKVLGMSDPGPASPGNEEVNEPRSGLAAKIAAWRRQRRDAGSTPK